MSATVVNENRYLCLITCTRNITAAECGKRSTSDGNFFNYCRLCSSPDRLCRYCPVDKRNLIPIGKEDGLCEECTKKNLKQTGTQWRSPPKPGDGLSASRNSKNKESTISQAQAQVLVNKFCIEESTHVEIAKLVQKLFKSGFNNIAIAKLMKRSAGWVVSHRNLLKLPDEILELVGSNSLLPTVALLLLKVPEKNEQIDLANEAAEESWVIKKMEEKIAQHLAKKT